MEDILAVYKRPYDPDFPLVCMDETTKQLTKEVKKSHRIEPGKPARYDYEYIRNGVSNVFMFFEPFGGKRYVRITKRRTKIDWAIQIKDILDNHYPNAKKIILVMEPLCTRRFLLLMREDFWNYWKSIILPNMAAGSILLKLNCVSCPVNV
jgi:hypothetical protein